MSYSKYLSKIIRSEHKTVLKLIKRCVKTKILQVLLTIPYENDMVYYKELLEKQGYTVEIITGSVKGKDRQRIFKAYDNGEIDVLIGYKVLDKGISIPQIGCLIDLYASSTKENIEQLVGRLNREGRGIDKKFYFCFTRPLLLGKQHSLKKRIVKNLAKKFKAKFKVVQI